MNQPDETVAAANRMVDAQDGPPSVMADLAFLLANVLGPARLNELLDQAYARAEADPNSQAMNAALGRGEPWPPEGP
jgi:hypothetical protein